MVSSSIWSSLFFKANCFSKMAPYILCVLLFVGLLSVQLEAASQHLKSHPHLRCSACQALTEQIGKKMNESAKIRRSVKTSHRFRDHSERYVDYEKSELRAIEILEVVCKEMESDYKLREGEDGIRKFSKDGELGKAIFYSKKDEAELDKASQKLRDVCYWITDEYDEVVVSLIRKERQLSVLTEKLCKDAIKVCGTPAVEAAMEEEVIARKNHMERKEKRTQKKREKEEAERQKAEKEIAEKSVPEAEGNAEEPTAENPDVQPAPTSENGEV